MRDGTVLWGRLCQRYQGGQSYLAEYGSKYQANAHQGDGAGGAKSVKQGHYGPCEMDLEGHEVSFFVGHFWITFCGLHTFFSPRRVPLVCPTTILVASQACLISSEQAPLPLSVFSLSLSLANFCHFQQNGRVRLANL